jgi:hypothetical protein
VELLERYLAAIGKHLPKEQRADILAELSDTIQSEVEDREKALGRPLSDDELSVILKRTGHPLLVAARYGGTPSLIGPALLPFYWNVLRIALIWGLVVMTVGALVAATHGRSPLGAFMTAWGTEWGSLFLIVGVVTVIFAVLERAGVAKDVAERWNPRTLPAVKPVTSRATLIFEIAMNTLFVLWAVGVPWVRTAVLFCIIGPVALKPFPTPIQVTVEWQAFVWPIVASYVVMTFGSIVNLLQPDLVRARAMGLLAGNVISVAAIALIAPKAGPFFAVSPGVADPAAFSAVAALNHVTVSTFIVGALICAGVAAFNAWRLIKLARIGNHGSFTKAQA